MDFTVREGTFPFTPEFRRNAFFARGDVIRFGHYYFSDDKKMEPILWRVIIGSMYESFADLMLMSLYGIDAVSYSGGADHCSWNNSELRRWLNNDFYNTAFDDEEKKYITKISKIDYVEQPDDYKVGFLLDGNECYCQATPYAAAKMKDDPDPLFGTVSHYDPEDEINYMERVPSADVCWIVPYQLSLDSSDSEVMTGDERTADGGGHIKVYNYVHYPEILENGEEFLNECIEIKSRNIKLKGLARPMITLSFRDPEGWAKFKAGIDGS